MKAAIVDTLGSPLEIRDTQTPSPGPGQVLVKLETSGLCHTDIHAAGKTRIVREARPLDDVNSCIDEVLSGDVHARLVFDLR